MVERYRPANGTEGADFMDWWCCRCERDAKFTEDNPELGCQILAATFRYEVDHPDYPQEWVWKDGEPCCTAFVQLGNEIPYRCDKTLDMFP